jgi:hypothetical protein
MKKVVIHGDFRIVLFPNNRFEILKVKKGIPVKVGLRDLK